LFLGIIISLSSCATTDYVGKTYAPTNNVDLYFDGNEVEVEYEVMGTARTEGMEGMSFNSIQNQLMKDAMKKGADGIIIDGLDEISRGSTSTTSSTVENKRVWNKNKTRYVSSTHTSEELHKIITAKLIKYKN